MQLRMILVVGIALLVSSCTQVPKQSVELSATIGRDLITVHNSHKALADLIFDRTESDINRFVDNIYTPYQIRAVMERQFLLAKSTDPANQKKSLLLAINNSFKPDASPQLQAAVLKGMSIMVQGIQNDIDKMRSDLLTPLREQRKELLASIDRSYQQLQYANSVVTGYLASVVQVHDAQAELLKAVGVDRDLNKEIGENLAKASENIGSIVDKAEGMEDKLNKAEETAKKLKEKIDELKAKLKISPKEG